MSYLAGAAVFFCEDFSPDEPSGFDYELDTAVTERALATGSFNGYCNVVGSSTTFRVTDPNVRENVISTAGESAMRHRLSTCAFSLARFDMPLANLRTTLEDLNRCEQSVFIAETMTPLHDAMQRLVPPERFTASEYFGETYASGDILNGVLHQDLQRTSFPDASFDLVVTSDVFEHVADAPAGEREILRILKPGGAYCFTVPLMPLADEDLVLARMLEDGEIEHFAEPSYHHDDLRPEGALVFRLFSVRQMTARFAALGATCTTYRLWSKTYGIIGTGGYVHVVRAPR